MGMLTFEEFKTERARYQKDASKAKYKAYKRKYALLNASDSESDEETSDEEEKPLVKKNKVEQFAQAMKASGVGVKDSVHNLSKARETERERAVEHRRAVFSKFILVETNW